MTGITMNMLSPIMPEIALFSSTILLLLLGLYGGRSGATLVKRLSSLVLLGVLYLTLNLDAKASQEVFGGMLRLDAFIQFAQVLILLGAILVLVISSDWLEWMKETRFEFQILILLATVGMMLMVAANDLLAVYLALELTSLSLYVLAAFRRDSLKATEAGLKYFVLGSLASGMMLFGMSLIYGFTGATSFTDIAEWLHITCNALPVAKATGDFLPMLQPASVGTLVGLILMITGFCFKASAAPFHMWTPDVYEGAPTPVTAFFAIVPKVAALVLFARILMQPFGEWLMQWQQVIQFVAAFSMLVGAWGALVQKNIKRMLAYSSIGHVGYVLVALAAGTQEALQAVLVYLAIYAVMSAGIFFCILNMRRAGEYVEEIDALSGLSKSQPFFAAVIAIFIFSLAGIPPLAGFFGKLYAFLAALKAGLVVLSIIGVLASVIAAYYYLRIVKIMYFDEEKEPLDIISCCNQKYVMGVLAVLVIGFILYPAPLLQGAAKAAGALWQ
jgi:NADH-quinone oxidoreductase subunit N